MTLEPTLISEHFPFLRETILSGLGVGLVPNYVVQDAVDCGAIVTALVDLRLSIFGNRIFMLYMPNRHRTRSARALIESLLAQEDGGAVMNVAQLPEAQMYATLH